MVTFILFYLLLVDAVICNLIAWFGERWYMTHLRLFSRFFPVTKGWAGYYMVLALWIGALTYGVI